MRLLCPIIGAKNNPKWHQHKVLQPQAKPSRQLGKLAYRQLPSSALQPTHHLLALTIRPKADTIFAGALKSLWLTLQRTGNPANIQEKKNMLFRSIFIRSAAVTSLLVASSLAQAGAPAAFVNFTPVAANPVPALSGYVLIALGLLLAVIAVRTLRNNEGAQKILSIMVLGGGLIISGVGADRTLAGLTPIIETIPVDECAGGSVRYGPNEGATDLKNSCSNSIEITGFETQFCTLDTASAACKVNGVLLAGDSCSLPLCLDV